MGCDIHSIAQVFKDGKWQTKIANVAENIRNYESFAVLANVRGTLPPICDPKGLPEDLLVILDEDGDIRINHPGIKSKYEGERT